MKKAILLLIVCILFMTGCWRVNPVFSLLRKTHSVDQTSVIPAMGYDSIHVEGNVSRINIQRSDTSESYVTLKGSLTANYRPELLVSEKESYIEIRSEKEGIKNPVASKNRLVLTVKIPENYTGSFDIRTTAGKTDIESFNLNRLEINSVSGDVFVNKTTADKFSIKTTSGDVYADSEVLDSIDIVTVSGNIECSASAVKIYMSSVSGNIISYVNAEDISIKTTSGKISQALPKSFGSINIKSVSGDVDISVRNNSDYHLEFDTLSGNFTSANNASVSKVSNRDITVIEGEGTGKIHISTTSGSLLLKK